MTTTNTAPEVLHFYRAIRFGRITKADKRDAPTERAIRLYCSQHKQAYELQIRGPLGIGCLGMEESKTGIIAGASLSREDMEALRDAINAELADA